MQGLTKAHICIQQGISLTQVPISLYSHHSYLYFERMIQVNILSNTDERKQRMIATSNWHYLDHNPNLKGIYRIYPFNPPAISSGPLSLRNMRPGVSRNDASTLRSSSNSSNSSPHRQLGNINEVSCLSYYPFL
jgi:hypothetical protein